MRTKSHATAAASQFATLCTYCGGFLAGLLYQTHPTAALVLAGGAVLLSVTTLGLIGLDCLLRRAGVHRSHKIGQR